MRLLILRRRTCSIVYHLLRFIEYFCAIPVVLASNSYIYLTFDECAFLMRRFLMIAALYFPCRAAADKLSGLAIAGYLITSQFICLRH